MDSCLYLPHMVSLLMALLLHEATRQSGLSIHLCVSVCLCEHMYLFTYSNWRKVKEMEDEEAQLCVVSYLQCVCCL